MKKRYLFTFWLIALSFIATATLLPDEDHDQDGWTNAEEIAAGTDPLNPTDYPRPEWNVEFLYFGTNANWRNESLIVFAYSERLNENAHGGSPDAVWMSGDAARHTERITFDDAGRATLSKGVAKPRTINIAGHTHGICDVPIDATTGSLWCYYSGIPTIDYSSGQISGGLPGVALPISYDWQYPDKHLAGGPNRFFGFMDLNKNGAFDAGEPCGLSEQRRTLVDATNTVATVIPLTDFLVGYPRIGWEPLETLEPYYSSEFYDVTIAVGAQVAANLKIKKPRTFLHEGDLLLEGIRGVNFYDATDLVYEYFVSDNDSTVVEGLFNFGLLAGATRRPMQAIYPNGGTVTNPVEFRWKMDYRTQGVKITVKAVGDSVDKFAEINTNPLPTLIGYRNEQSSYYRTTPQLVDGMSSVTLPAGDYTYTIAEIVNTTSSLLTKQTVTGTFTVEEE